MTTPAETFQRASFAGIAFPILRRKLKCGLRFHPHEFPHSPGAEIEKMGRKPYEVSMTAFFHDVPESILDRDYPDLYPAGLFSLQSKCDDETTGPLVIPGVGTLQVVATDWERTLDYSVALSGELVEITFVEDQERDTIFEKVDLGRGSLERQNYMMQFLVGGIYPHDPPSIFQAINDVITSILAIEGAADAFSKVLEAKLLQVINLCQTAERLAELQLPENHPLLTALKNVWLAAQDFAEDILERGSPIQIWTVPKLMSVSEASIAIFGSSTHAVDLMQLNPIEDVFAIPAGSALRYYSAA